MAIAAPTLTDEDMQQQVVNELKRDAELEASEIGVATSEGLVTLAGRVDRFGQKWAAERAVLRVRGVNAVANLIEVHLPAGDERTDLDISAAAAHALAWNTQVPHDAVQVSVSNGRVTLRGEVDADFRPASPCPTS
jgi:osmotically-inducible protein OsmY